MSAHQFWPDFLLDYRFIKYPGALERKEWRYTIKFRLLERGTRREILLEDYVHNSVEFAIFKVLKKMVNPGVYPNDSVPGSIVSYVPSHYKGFSISWVMPDGGVEITWHPRRVIAGINLALPKHEEMMLMMLMMPVVMANPQSKFSKVALMELDLYMHRLNEMSYEFSIRTEAGKV